MIVLDASVVIAYGRTTDAHHNRSATLLTTTTDEFAIHALTMTECLVGPTRLGRERDLLKFFRVLGVRRIDLDADAPVRLARLRVSTGLKLPDCCVLDSAIRHGADLATFDAGLSAAAKAHGVTIAV